MFDKNLFTELRVLAVPFGDRKPTDETLAKALTVNANIESLGLTMKPDDLVRLAASSAIDTVYETLKGFVGDVKAEPMYPDFPNQVMNIDKAVFRFHQMVHYFTTYGIELLTWDEVTRGWLPEVKSTPKLKKNDKLLSAKVIDLIDEVNKYEYAMTKVLSKRERMTAKEHEMVIEALPYVSGEFLSSLSIPFKQNMLSVFVSIFDTCSEKRVAYLKMICKHTGDVLKCMDYLLTRKRFHLHTSEKRALVKLLESYSVNDFEANLILSGKKADRHKIVLNFVDYNEYSRSAGHKEAVRKLRNDELRSWESIVKSMIKNEPMDKTLQFIAARPGMLLRMLTFLYRNGASAESLKLALTSKAVSLSTQTIVTTLEAFGKDRKNWNNKDKFALEKETKVIYDVLLSALYSNLQSKETVLKNKKVFVDAEEFDLAHSDLRPNKKSDMGGYIQSGIAYRIPDDIRYLRFFVYWNDDTRVDVDLHAFAIDVNNQSIHVGWNGNFRSRGIVYSGDITHSDAAEYIDIDMNNKNIDIAGINFHLFYGQPTFKEVEECFVGMLAVNSLNEDVQLYDPKNCFFSHDLHMPTRRVGYGYIDVQNRYLRYEGIEDKFIGDTRIGGNESGMSLARYITTLLSAQDATVVTNKEDADIILTMAKSKDDNAVCLIDNNYFLD